MSAVTLEWEGLTQLEKDLRDLPADLRTEAVTITRQAAEDAAATMAALYPKRTGLLASSLLVSQSEPGPYATRAMVINTAPYALVFDLGSQARHTALGANNPMPAGNVFIPTMIRTRRAMYDALKDVLQRTGLTVSGDV